MKDILIVSSIVTFNIYFFISILVIGITNDKLKNININNNIHYHLCSIIGKYDFARRKILRTSDINVRILNRLPFD